MSTGMGMEMSAPPHARANWDKAVEDKWMDFDKSSNAVSLGVVASVILISMFLAIVFYKKFIRSKLSSSSSSSSSSSVSTFPTDMEAQGATYKLDFPSDYKMKNCSNDVSVLMPGEVMPTFIAHPAHAPAPAPASGSPEHVLCPLHQ